MEGIYMKHTICLLLFLSMTYIISGMAYAEEISKTISGETLFLENCSRCHPKGGNIINPSKTLNKRTLAAINLDTEDALLQYLLNPGPGMPRLIHRESGLSEPDARKIIRFILTTFSEQGDTAMDSSGAILFRDNCYRCHPDGGNIINPSKTLHQNSLAANNLQSENALLQYLINPGPGMPRLIHRENGLSEPDAKKIIQHIMKTFK
jgi:cytochrome c6